MEPDKTTDPNRLRKEEGIRFKHFVHKTTGKILATLVSKPLNADGSLVEAAVAVCSSYDAGTRVIGREQALKKLVAGEVTVFPKEELADLIRNRTILKKWNKSYPGPHRLRPPSPAPMVISGVIESISVSGDGKSWGKIIDIFVPKPEGVLNLSPEDRDEIE